MADDRINEAAESYKGQAPAPEMPAQDAWEEEAARSYRGEQTQKRSTLVGQAVWGNPELFAKISEAAAEVQAPWGLGDRKPQDIKAETAKQTTLEKMTGTEVNKKALEDMELAHIDAEKQ